LEVAAGTVTLDASKANNNSNTMACMLNTIISNISSNPVAWLALLVSLVSAGFTIWKIRRDLTRQSSQDYLTAATRLLEQAYGVFEKSRNGKWLNLPQPSRRLWLTVARMIQESEGAGSEITEPSHKLLYDHARNFWRGQFNDLSQPLERVSLKYFAVDADSILVTSGDTRMSLSEKSLRVILEFLEWPANRQDPIAHASDYTDNEISRMRAFRFRPVADFLEAQQAMLGQDENRQRAWREKWAKAFDPEK
jgi:hypothetical protein